MKFSDVKYSRTLEFSYDCWKVEVKEVAVIPMKSFKGDNFFKTEWEFHAAKTTGEDCLNGTFLTDYDTVPDKYEVVAGIQNYITSQLIKMIKYF